MSVPNTVPSEEFHGIGNNFFVVDVDDPVLNRPAFARTHCDCEAGTTLSEGERRGADDILFLAFESRYNPLWIVMMLVQPDGSAAAMCDNGAHVVAAWAAERTGTNEVTIDTPAGTCRASLDGTDATVEVGAPSSASHDVPFTSDDELVDTEVEGLTVTAVNTGVPHVVAFVDDVDDVDLESVAPPVCHVSVFPEGVNVTFVSPDGEGGLRQRTFERGVEGGTQSYGTGAVVAVVATRHLGRVSGDGPVTVTSPGGAFSVTVPDEGAAFFGSPAVYEGDGETDIAFHER